MTKLREYQRAGSLPEFSTFCDEMLAKNHNNHNDVLEQRLSVLRQFVAESPENSALRNEQEDLDTLVVNGTMVVADLTDPLLSSDEVNSVFQVVLEQFRQCPITTNNNYNNKEGFGCGKVVLVHDAHNYLHGGTLSDAVVDTVRRMRHENIRVVISTQSPLTLRKELWELTTMAVLHHFHAPEWYTFLSQTLPLPRSLLPLTNFLPRVRALATGEALVFATQMALGSATSAIRASTNAEEDGTGTGTTTNTTYPCILLRVRPRITRGDHREQDFDRRNEEACQEEAR